MTLALSLLLILVQLAFLCVVLVAFAIVFAGTISVTLDVPYVPTPRRYWSAIAQALDIQAGDVVYELGSGDGGLLLALARAHPDAQFVGVELNPPLFWFSQVRRALKGSLPNIRFERQDLFMVDLSRADKCYGYLLDPVMGRLLPKLEREASGARFVSRAFQFKSKRPIETIVLSTSPGRHGEHLLYVYDL